MNIETHGGNFDCVLACQRAEQFVASCLQSKAISFAACCFSFRKPISRTAARGARPAARRGTGEWEQTCPAPPRPAPAPPRPTSPQPARTLPSTTAQSTFAFSSALIAPDLLTRLVYEIGSAHDLRGKDSVRSVLRTNWS